MMRVTFLGVRGSFPCPSPINRRYGGNTAAVSLHVDGEAPILLDLGTGLLQFDASEGRADGRPFRASALVTHLHLDHVQGLPFFPPVHERGAELDVYAPRQSEGSLRDAFALLVDPPFFPVPLDEIVGEIRFHEVCNDEFAIEAVLELCEGADLLIHEGQYTPQEFPAKADWGHSTIDYAIRVATEAGARRLCLFHHDPWRSDDDLDALVTQARKALRGATEEVMAAAEGMTLIVATR